MRTRSLLIGLLALLLLPTQALAFYGTAADGSESSETIPCIADACAPLPEPPEDPDPSTLVENLGNPPPEYVREEAKGNGKGKKGQHAKHHRKKKPRHRGGQGR